MRQFVLQSRNGEQFDLMRKDAFFSEPDGLGFADDLTFGEVGSSWVLTKQTRQRPEPSGQMVFAGYTQYEEFAAFAARKSLKLGYKSAQTWIWLPCIVSLEKGEIGQNRRLCCGVTFHATGPWAEEVSFVQGGLDAYGIGYPISYGYTYGKGNPGLIQVKNGLRQSPFKLYIFGPAQNPAWRVVQNGTLIGTGKMNLELLADRELLIDSNPANMRIAEYTRDGAFVANRYASSDFSTQRILLLPSGTSKIYTSDDNGVISAAAEVAKLV